MQSHINEPPCLILVLIYDIIIPLLLFYFVCLVFLFWRELFEPSFFSSALLNSHTVVCL